MLNELEVTVEGEDTGGKEDDVEGVALGFPAKALEKGAWGQGLLAAAVLSVEAVAEEHEDADTDEDGVVFDVVCGGDAAVLFGWATDCEVDAVLGSGKQAEE